MPGGRKPKATTKTDWDSTHNYSKAEKQHREKVSNAMRRIPAGLSCPKELKDPIAQKEWRRLMPLYRKMEIDVLNDLDVPTLMAYCMAHAVYMRALEDWNKDPTLKVETYNKHGLLSGIKENPVLKTMRDQGTLIARYAEILCLSPVGRIRMGILPKDKPKKEKKTGLQALFDDNDDEPGEIKA
jgi:P27 family predicted phage terminase small subunit